MGRIYYKELPLFHLYDGDLAGTQKLLMTLLLVERYDIYELSCLARMRPEEAATELAELKRKGVSARQVKIGKKFARQRNDFVKPRCSEPCTDFTDARGAARFPAKSRGSRKSIPLTYEKGIDRRFSREFQENRILHHTAKRVFGNANLLRCFHHKNLEDFMSIRNEIKAQIVRAGFTMQELVDRLAEEYDWSDSVSNLSAKLQRESIRYKEVVELADVLDCDIVWVKRGNRR